MKHDETTIAQHYDWENFGRSGSCLSHLITSLVERSKCFYKMLC